MQKTTSFSRRDFIRFTGITGTGLLIGLDMACKETPKMASLSEVKNWYEFAPVLNIADNGIVTIFNPKPEIGQGVWQSIPSLICEELEVPLETVVIKHTGGEKKFGDKKFTGNKFGGSKFSDKKFEEKKSKPKSSGDDWFESKMKDW